tara:strand:+ start:1886 stop:4285 length:2400 start_codon:yes stop_codon:yes gene_type:complete
MGKNRQVPSYMTDGSSAKIDENQDSGVSLAVPTPEELSIDNSVGENIAVATDKSSGLIDSLYDAWTGDNADIEFPDLPETTDLEDYSFWDEFTNPTAALSLMFARDDWSKAEIIKNNFADDNRFGGIKYDKFNNPMLEWSDKLYYVNKPGASEQDMGTIMGEVVKYLPASKVVNASRSIAGRILSGLGLYTLTEAGGEGIESQLAPEVAKGKKRSAEDVAVDSAKMGAISTGMDLVVPPILRAPKAIAQGVTRTGARLLKKDIPSWAEPVIKSKSKYGLTQGQAQTKTPGLGTKVPASERIMEEDFIRNAPGAESAEAKKILDDFDENQLNAIRNDAQKLQYEMGSKKIIPGEQADNVPTTSTQDIKQIVTDEAKNLKKQSKESYDFVGGALDQPQVSVEGLTTILNQIRNNPEFKGLLPRQLKRMTILAEELSALSELEKAMSRPGSNYKQSIDFNEIVKQQKVINEASRTAERGSPEARLLGMLKGEFDKFVFDGIDSGFITGNKVVIDQLKKATDLYKKYIGISGKGTAKDKAQKAVNNILADLTNPAFEADKVVNVFFGHSKFNPTPVMAEVLRKMKANLPEEKAKEVIGLVKDAVLHKAFSGKGNEVTRTNIVQNYNDIFNKNKNLINMLFSKKEIEKIADFRKNVAPTLWADPAYVMNKSGSAYVFTSAMARNGLLTQLEIPIVSQVSGGLNSIRNTNIAYDAIKNYVTRQNQPLFDFPLPGGYGSVLERMNRMFQGQASIVPKGVDSDRQALLVGAKEDIIGTEEVDTSALKSLASSIDAETRKKILQQVGQ